MIRSLRRRTNRMAKVYQADLTPSKRVVKIVGAFIGRADEMRRARLRELVVRARGERKPPVASAPPPPEPVEQASPEPPTADPVASDDDDGWEDRASGPNPIMGGMPTTREPQWWEEYARWRPRGEPDPYDWPEDDEEEIDDPFGIYS